MRTQNPRIQDHDEGAGWPWSWVVLFTHSLPLVRRKSACRPAGPAPCLPVCLSLPSTPTPSVILICLGSACESLSPSLPQSFTSHLHTHRSNNGDDPRLGGNHK